MPRRRPAQLRAAQPIEPRPGRKILQISGVSAATRRAIAELERTRLALGDIADALDAWARFVRGPARTITDYEPEYDCCQSHDPVVQRRTLLRALHALPTEAARELRALVQPLDDLYLTRSIPTPETAHIRRLLTGVVVEPTVPFPR
ncbi:hypothetical protein [Actinophytocola sp.]|uniref:hypothetical protein n=1 Tax=Actinophytocola sp. TaxID=1872138 RepID=UPI002ECFEDCA